MCPNRFPYVIEMFNIFLTEIGLFPSIMNDILTLDQYASYILRSGVTATRRNIRTRKFGFGTISPIEFCKQFYGKSHQTIKKIQID